MRCPLDAGPAHSPAWKRLLLTGVLITSCTCFASLELPVPRNPSGVLSPSWFRGHNVQPETTIFSPEGLPGPIRGGQETLGTQSSLLIGNARAQDPGLETSRGRGSATEQILGQASSNGVILLTFPYEYEGVIQSDLNYSVILECLASSITPKPVLHWTFNGKPYQTGARLIIRRLSWEHLGTYVCTAKNSVGQYSSYPVTLSLPQDNVDPTDAEPIEPDPVPSVSGGAAIGLLVAGNMGAAMLIGGISFTIVQSIRSNRHRIRSCC